jgi:ACS family pantothenate transporter-like MFS transporter
MAEGKDLHPPPTVSSTGVTGAEDPYDGQENGWLRFMTWLRWYPKGMPLAEKQLVLKLDLMILVYGCLCFFTKYMSQASLTNAFVT